MTDRPTPFPRSLKDYDVQVISTPNQGLGQARNEGLAAARGEFVVYIDDDAYPPPPWLKYLALAFLRSDHACIGGPNLVPPEDGWIGQCVADSPGGPLHVLLTDEVAEHVPGCNMAFRRSRLAAIGGFDPLYRTAGDDVDVCWRLQDKGWTVGFSAPAMVWHHRRATVRRYWRQQVGYGKAEALLERKWPSRFTALGHMTWAGQIYGRGLPQARTHGTAAHLPGHLGPCAVSGPLHAAAEPSAQHRADARVASARGRDVRLRTARASRCAALSGRSFRSSRWPRSRSRKRCAAPSKRVFCCARAV